MSKVDLEQNCISSKQEKENLDFWDTYCIFSDGSDSERESIKPKCNKYLKKKLKKYRKRKNGEEDPDVLEVSLSLNECLYFPLKDNHNNNNEVDVEDCVRLPNYLMKMVRHNKNSQKTVKAVIKSNSKECDKSQDIVDKKQESKRKNAFQLMMNSRNKSIGSNSPGKEKNDDDDDFEEDVVQRKATKAKRNLLLQKMAEAKGALKNKEVEEIQEEIISQKMQKRAKRLKEMITKESKNAKNNNQKSKKWEEKSDKAEEAAKSNKNKLCNKIIDVDVPVCPGPVIVSPLTKKISKEDEDFLNKLSPSIKKKENMLCYFKKIEKETEIQPVVDINGENMEAKDSSVIKVKLGTKNKKSLKKRKLSLKPTLIEGDSKDCNENNFNSPNILATPLESPKVTDAELAATETGSRKRKRRTKLDNNTHREEALNVEAIEGRPRRHVKKPVKYVEDVNLSSSDDELLIITPKKKKHKDKEFMKHPNKGKESSSGFNNKNKLKNKETTKKLMKQEPKGKLAPIFVPKPQIDPAVLEAKQKFLQSGVPEQLKKIAAQQIVQINNSICFHSVVHVRQETNVYRNEVKFDFYESSYDSSESDNLRADDSECGDKFFKNLLSLQKPLEEATNVITPNTIDTKEILQSIKDMYPEFPVYRTYRILKNKSKGDHTDVNFVEFDNSNEALNATLDTTTEDPKSLCWVDKYRATSTKQIIGNFESMKELRKWLASWKESQVCSKNSQVNDSDSDFYHSDTDSRDNAAMANNLVIVTGPAGSGKTSGVHATAAELAFKVIEVNVGSRRTGKILLQDLQEATQSHKVNRAKGGSADNSQNILDCLSKSQSKKQRKTKQKSNSQRSENSQPLFSQEDGRTGMSLILIDDADIVFEQDDGFISGILQLVQCSKRPVVIVTSSLTSQNMQRFLNCDNIVKLRPLLPRMLGTWLDLVCLAELGAGWPGAGAALLDYCQGDIRKATNSLNFYAFSEVHKQNIAFVEDENSDDEQKVVNCDETSNISWAGGDSEEIKCTAKSQDLLLNRDIIANFKDSSDLGDKWWCLHDVLGIRNDSSKDCKRLENITTAVEALSLGDLFNKRSTRSVVCPTPWYTPESDSVTERDSLESVNNFYDTCSEISMHLVERTIAKTNESNASRKGNTDATSYMLQRDRDKTISRHKLLSESLVPCSILDRKAIALDYWPTFRAICRAEKVKTDCNLKRNNRFTHYLKTTKIGAKSEVFTKLGDVLNIK